MAANTEGNGENAYAWNNLGLALMATKNWDDAVVALQTATQLAHPEPYMFANLGGALEHADRVAEARSAYRDGAKRGSTESRKALLRLDELKASAPPEPPGRSSVGTQRYVSGGHSWVVRFPISLSGM